MDMTANNVLNNLLGVEIVLNKDSQDMNQTDIDNLVSLHSLMEVARKDFLKGSITFEEYLELLNMAGMNIDDYCLNLENNLTTIGIL
jgi:hypothetical protein